MHFGQKTRRKKLFGKIVRTLDRIKLLKLIFKELYGLWAELILLWMMANIVLYSIRHETWISIRDSDLF